MQNINNVTLSGRLTADPLLRKTTADKSVASFTLAVNRRANAKAETIADFINCITWNALAENIARHLSKGSFIELAGRIQTRNYEDKNGVKRTAVEVVANEVNFLDSKRRETNEIPTENNPEVAYTDLDSSGDELPF